MRLDSFGKNHWFNIRCPTHDVSSEHCAVHHCVHGKGRLSLGYRSGPTLRAPGYTLISVYACRIKIDRPRLPLQQWCFLSHAPSFPLKRPLTHALSFLNLFTAKFFTMMPGVFPKTHNFIVQSHAFYFCNGLCLPKKAK